MISDWFQRLSDSHENKLEIYQPQNFQRWLSAEDFSVVSAKMLLTFALLNGVFRQKVSFFSSCYNEWAQWLLTLKFAHYSLRQNSESVHDSSQSVFFRINSSNIIESNHIRWIWVTSHQYELSFIFHENKYASVVPELSFHKVSQMLWRVVGQISLQV